MEQAIKDSYLNAAKLISDYIENSKVIEQTVEISRLLAKIFLDGNKVMICGNGGSACDAMHFAEEFTGQYRKKRRALPVISLTDASHITCVGNDYGFSEIFARGVEAYGKKGDVLIGLSTSGNSENVICAFDKAKELEMISIALLGKTGGKLQGKCQYEFIAPGATSDRIQEIHMVILHILIEGVERIMFPNNYKS